MKNYIIDYFVVIILSIISLFTINLAYGDTLTLNVYPQNSTATINPAIITMNGKLYSENIWLEDVYAGKTQAAADETFIAKVIASNQNGTPADVLNIWNPDEQSKMAFYITNPTNSDGFTKNQAWYKLIKYSAPLVKVSFGEYTIFIIQHTMQDATNIAKLYAIKSVNGTYYMTNLLSNDPIFVYYIIKLQNQVNFKIKPVQ
jgi:hypothetical protein